MSYSPKRKEGREREVERKGRGKGKRKLQEREKERGTEVHFLKYSNHSSLKKYHKTPIFMKKLQGLQYRITRSPISNEVDPLIP